MTREYRRSERRACQLAGIGRSSCRYQARQRDDPELRQRLCELAGERRSDRSDSRGARSAEHLSNALKNFVGEPGILDGASQHYATDHRR